jgi:hypothetical protein
VAAPFQFACKLEMMEDAKDSLYDSHDGPEREVTSTSLSNGYLF